MALTPEQQAAEALKAAAEKKAADTQKATDETPDDSKETDPEEKLDAAKLQAENKKLREENAKRRIEAKTTKETLDRQSKALAILQGKDEPDVAPLEKAKADADRKMRNALLKGELASVAKDAHDIADVFAIGSSLFKEVAVDVENETVDREALKEAVDGLRKSKPFLFESSEENPTIVSPKGPPLPKDRAAPKGGTSEKAQWNALKAAGRNAEANEFYAKHKDTIRRQLS